MCERVFSRKRVPEMKCKKNCGECFAFSGGNCLLAYDRDPEEACETPMSIEEFIAARKSTGMKVWVAARQTKAHPSSIMDTMGLTC
jgi:hypothetical protein